MPNENANDRVKLSVYTATNGAWRLITSRVYAQGLVARWQEPMGDWLEIEGRINDVDQNKINTTLRKAIITGIDIGDINQEF